MTPESSKDLLAYTPMLHARMFTETATFRNHHFQPTRSGLSSMPVLDQIEPTDRYLDGNPSVDRPLFVQFCTNSPEEYLQAAEYVQSSCDAVDLNLGCPQGIARKGQYGAFLQEDWDLVYRLINKLHQKLDVPVTAKIRILETKEKTLDYAKVVLSAGASIITVHGRRREQKGHNTGLADWSVLRHLRDHLPAETVIFANGNILRHEDIGRCLEETGADGVMSAEGNLYDPTIFAKPPAVGQEGREYWRGRDGKGGYRMDAVFRRYMDILYQHVLETPPPERKPLFLPSDPTDSIVESGAEGRKVPCDGERPSKQRKRDKNAKRCTSPNLVAMQPHLFHLLRSLVSRHTDIRDALARCRAGDITAFENVLSMVERVTNDGLMDYDFNPAKYEEAYETNSQKAEKSEEEGKDESSLAMVKACKRPWWVCQPYVRPLPKEALEKGSMTLSKKNMKKLEENETIDDESHQSNGEPLRERIDRADGVPKAEMPKESMVCG